MKGPHDQSRLGIVEWFRIGDYERVEQSLKQLQALEIRHLRTHLSWADYHAEGGETWYDWLLPTLARQVELLPCVHYTPPSLSETGRTSGPPRNLRALADFVDHAIDRYGAHFDAIELWNEPNNLLDWDWQVDIDWLKFAEMMGAAAHWARERGKRVVMGGPCPTDLNWLALMGERGVLQCIDELGLHGFPGTWDSEEVSWTGWADLVNSVRATIEPFNDRIDLSITETGYSTWRHEPFIQIKRFLDALEAPVHRIYWYALQDLPYTVAVQEGLRFDERHYHFGLYDHRGKPKLLGRLLETGGIDAVKGAVAHEHAAPALRRTHPVLVTGGAGFIGSNLAHRLASNGEHVLVYDALTRPGVEANLAWLRREHPSRVSAVVADLRDDQAIGDAAESAVAVFHLAAQVAVTTSCEDPLGDFHTNVEGTLLLLEKLRQRSDSPPLIFASTNKVYGDLADVALALNEGRYQPRDDALRANGIGPDRPIEFHTPYGCSKGAADQYVLDYARTFGMDTAVLRMSCIYGPRQFGTEDQGWVAHFLLRALAEEPITLYGDGRQVRDILHVDDAVDAYLATWRHIGRVRGKALNLGGGPRNAVSLLEVIAHMEALLGRRVEATKAPWRAGDQRYFVADTRETMRLLNLKTPIGWRTGVASLAKWCAETRGLALPEPPGRAEANVVPLHVEAS